MSPVCAVCSATPSTPGRDTTIERNRVSRARRPGGNFTRVRTMMRGSHVLQRNGCPSPRQPSSQRYLLRTLVRCGQCQLHRQAARQLSVCKRYEYLYSCCAGQDPVTVGRVERCTSRRVRADRLDALVWTLVCELLQDPQVILQA